MPAKWKYGFLCDGAMQVQGKWTYQGLFDRLFSAGYPALQGEAVLCARFNGPVGAHALRIHLVDSKGKQILPELRQPIECREFVDNDISVHLRALPVPAEGFYTFRFYLDDEPEVFGIVEFQAVLQSQAKRPKEGGE